MLTDPRLWLYLIIFFSCAALMRLFLNHFRRMKRFSAVLLYLAIATAFSAVFWIFTPGFSFSSYQGGVFFCLSAILPGLLLGFHFSFLILPPLTVIFLSWFFQTPLSPPLYRETKSLGTLTFYPAQKGQLFYEWQETVGKHKLGTLAGSKIAPLVRKELLPDYLFFLESSWVVAGLLSENLAISQIPSESTEIFRRFSVLDEKAFPFVQYEFPALRFMDPGYFNSYTFVLRENKELMIIESKHPD
ncbi:MAG: hypothetical protein B6241_12280 [Spirochaetaceae bacterium 4572_59]|nr:MAG: hypothetical protein B6241_12280 [Spirochaetaceae bacterium 4572_59]